MPIIYVKFSAPDTVGPYFSLFRRNTKPSSIQTLFVFNITHNPSFLNKINNLIFHSDFRTTWKWRVGSMPICSTDCQISWTNSRSSDQSNTREKRYSDFTLIRTHQWCISATVLELWTPAFQIGGSVDQSINPTPYSQPIASYIWIPNKKQVNGNVSQFCEDTNGRKYPTGANETFVLSRWEGVQYWWLSSRTTSEQTSLG